MRFIFEGIANYNVYEKALSDRINPTRASEN